VDPEESFRLYVRERIGALSRIAYLLTGDRHLAEDLVQETLLRVAGRWPRIVAGGDPDPYVRQALYHHHVSAWRHMRNRRVVLQDPPDRPGPDEASAVTAGIAVRDALARLAPRQRAVLVLRYFEDLTEAQTAEILRCRVGTVKSQTRDALARLRAIAPDLLLDSTDLGVPR
jgi:RNA polymerase sigma-70 factor (sigma-E family)